MDLLSTRFLHTHVRIANRRLILETIIKSSEISRVDLHTATGLTKATVSAIVAELIDDKLVIELGAGKTSRGRKPIMLKFSEKTGLAAGISIDTDEINFVITDLYGRVLAEQSVEISEYTPEKILKVIKPQLEKLLIKCGHTHYSLTGIGCAIPGTIDKNGIIVKAPYLEWENINFSDMLHKLTGVPVYCENTANMLAVAELINYPEEQSAICLRIRSGIRAGIIIEGEIFTGIEGYAGEVGHMPVEEDGLLCRCGQHGCWETRVSELALVKALNDAGIIIDKKSDFTLETTGPVMKIFSEYARRLGAGLISMINMFNPGHIIINSPLISRNIIILSLVKEELSKRLYPVSVSSCNIELSTAPKNASCIGAAINAADKFISRISVYRPAGRVKNTTATAVKKN